MCIRDSSLATHFGQLLGKTRFKFASEENPRNLKTVERKIIMRTKETETICEFLDLTLTAEGLDSKCKNSCQGGVQRTNYFRVKSAIRRAKDLLKQIMSMTSHKSSL